MKKFICLIMILVLTLAMSLPAFAANTDITPADLGYTAADLEDSILIVIRDADNNILKTQLIRYNYVDGTQVTIPANGTFTTYQYYASTGFGAGFYFNHITYGDPATTRDKTLSIKIRKAASVGGTRTNLITGTFSTNEEDNIYHSGYNNGSNGLSVAISVPADPSKPYHDAVYTNLSSTSIVVSMLVSVD